MTDIAAEPASRGEAMNAMPSNLRLEPPGPPRGSNAGR
jgi:hypothetical protein